MNGRLGLGESWRWAALGADEPTAGWLHLEGFMPFEATRDHPRFQAILEAEARRVGRV